MSIVQPGPEYQDLIFLEGEEIGSIQAANFAHDASLYTETSTQKKAII
jgi:hypothetical protein